MIQCIYHIDGRMECANTLCALTQPTDTSGSRAKAIIASTNALVGFPGRFALIPVKRDASERKTMSQQTATKESDERTRVTHVHIIEVLTNLRTEWELAASGKSLLAHKGSVGLILFDIVTHLNLTIDEQQSLMGTQLFSEISDFVTKID